MTSSSTLATQVTTNTNSLYSLCFTLLRVHSPGLIKRKQMKSPIITEKISPTQSPSIMLYIYRIYIYMSSYTRWTTKDAKDKQIPTSKSVNYEFIIA